MIKRPLLNKGEHPIERGVYNIPTKEISDLYDEVSNWISNRAQGGIIYGRPRLGKTRAIACLIQYLKYEFGDDLPVFTALWAHQLKPSENRFYSELLKHIGYSAYSQGKAEVKKDRLIKYLIHKATNCVYRKIILFIDEAHMLFEQDYNWLMDIYNQLDRHSINFTVILVGQKELLFQKDSFIRAKRMQLVGRFMVQQYKFSGIKSIEDLKICLQGYDTLCEYPVGSGFSYTRYFFPEAFDEGNRLSDNADIIFNQFEELKSKNNIKSTLEIPMQFISLTIEICLKKYGANGKGIYWPSMQEWNDAIKISGYVRSEICTSMFTDID